MTKIQKTKEYSIFKKHESNREINQANLKKVVASISAANLLEFRPILVDKGMRVIDGQHRLEAAKALGVDIYYQVNEESTHEDIVLLNTVQKRWRNEDYIEYHISRGNLEYKKFKDFAAENALSTAELLCLLKGGADGAYDKMRKGELGTLMESGMDSLKKDIADLNQILSLLNKYVIGNKLFLKSSKFKRALLQIIKNPEVNLDKFLDNLTRKIDCIHPCATTAAAYAMFRDVYNWKNPNPI